MIVIAVVLWIAFYMVLEAFSVALSGSVFLSVPFGDAWSMAWDRPWMLLAFVIITIVCRNLGELTN